MTEFQRYLQAKRTLDDRALDQRLLTRLSQHLSNRQAQSTNPLTVLEVGAGIGTMITRLHEWDIFPKGRIEYTAIDKDAASIERLPKTLAEMTGDQTRVTETTDHEIQVEGPNRTIMVKPVIGEITAFIDAHDQAWEAVIGAALLDVLGLENLPKLLDALVPNGVWYFPITFDGGTYFRPAHPADDRIEQYYHTHMDQSSGGSSHAGGRVLKRLVDRPDTTVLGVAGSDWIVRPTGGQYTGEERLVLEYILTQIDQAVSDVAPEGFEETLLDWLDDRYAQVAEIELYYFTHQLDILGRLGAGDTASNGVHRK